tara:strand:+ start:2453 stop:3121 length:669 start_codon:yes stop_codon:yes gene_type:complete
MPLRKEIIYPIFLECSQFTTDIFWQNIFEDLAYGITPYGTYFSKDYLCCNYKKKEFNYKIEKKDSNTLFKEVYNILTKKLGLLSQIQKIERKKDFVDFEDKIKDSRKTWNDIRKKNIKELLIEQYAVKMKNKFSLSIKQSRQLFKVIIIALVLKIITTNDIHYENGSILKIQGIDFEPKKIIFERNLYKIEFNFSPNIIIEKKLMSDNWEKYLKEIKKLEPA